MNHNERKFNMDIAQVCGLREAVIADYIRSLQVTSDETTSWNGNKPKIDIRQWSPDHTKMARGITLTENQARNLARILGERYRDRGLSTPARNMMER